MDLLTRERLYVYPRIFVAQYVAVGVYLIGWGLLKGPGLIDALGRPVGTDFVAFWSGSYLARTGEAAAVFNLVTLHALEQKIIGAVFDAWAWNYPPTFLLLVLPLSVLPYLVSLAAWLGVTMGGYLWVLRRLAPHPATLWLALGFTGTFENFFHGQNGFLSAALLGGGLLLLDRRPWCAGALLGLLSYKPHLMLLLPVALAAGRRWRPLTAMVLSAAGLALASYLALGPATWLAFWRNLPFSLRIMETGSDLWFKMPTVFAAVLVAGGSLPVARLVQGAVTLATVAAVAWVWLKPAPLALKSAALVAGIFLATPYAFEYDLAILALALAWLGWEAYTGGWLPGEQTVLLLCWLAPLAAPALAKVTGLPLAPLPLAALLLVALRRVRRSRAAPC
jgi:hypothetical protein